MKVRLPKGLQKALEARHTSGALRSLQTSRGFVDLCSNDYLGLARILAMQAGEPSIGPGATGSRLVSGNTPDHEALERFLASFHGTESALLFGSGYEANIGLLGCLGSRTDTIVYDELCHASMRDGIRLSTARAFSFRHNDLDDLTSKLNAARGDVFVVVESVYSMDGDLAPLRELAELCTLRGAFLVVDEAHATGVYGDKGEGLVQALGLTDSLFARVHTFGKALGFRGAAVVGSRELHSYLQNFARSFIYSTAPDAGTLATISTAYGLQAEMKRERGALRELISQFRDLTRVFPNLSFLQSESPIQGVIIPGNERVLRVEEALAAGGFSARAIRSPTVPQGAERIRLCLHAFNTRDEIERALSIIASAVSEEVCSAHGA